MEVAFFTEMGFTGKVSRTHSNMRTEFAWMSALQADHYNINHTPYKNYDLGIVIIPKKNPNLDLNRIKIFCKKVGVMQEGPHWYFQDYDIKEQINYFNNLVNADIIFTHNKRDKKYYQGLTEHKDVRILPTLMIEDTVKPMIYVKRKGVIIGGNFVNWYGGFDSFIVAKEIEDEVWAPSMGRKQKGEEQLVKHLPYLNWTQWINKLNEFRIGVHLMRTHAAGTFALNCAYLGIPCIGYEGLDTQETCFPETTVEVGDIEKAKEIIRKLDYDGEFYYFVSNKAKINYEKFYHENVFHSTFHK